MVKLGINARVMGKLYWCEVVAFVILFLAKSRDLVFHDVAGSFGSIPKTAWDIGDLFYIKYGINEWVLITDEITFSLQIIEGHGDGGTGGGAKPALTFEQFDVDGSGQCEFQSCFK